MLTNRKKQKMALNSSDESLDIYRQHFAKMNSNNLPSHSETVEPIIYQSADLPAYDLMKDFVSPSSLGWTLKWIAWNKSAGSTGLSYDLLKVAPLQVLQSISLYFRLIIEMKCVPSSWKTAIVVPVPKKGDLCDIVNYRPISLTETLRKLFEHAILKFINKSIDSLYLTQGGFRTNHSCNDMIVTLHEAARQNKKRLHIAFLDIRAAYDSVDRRILWRRCRNRGIPREIVELLKQMFDSNSGQVVVGGRRSRPFKIESGVLQGSVLSPCLYSLFIDDLAKMLGALPTVKVGDANINCTFYADDIALFAENSSDLQILLNACADHAQKNRYRFNTSKCEVITDESKIFMIDGQELPHTTCFKYLGVEFSRKGIEYDKFMKRRSEDALTAATRLSGMGMNIGGFSTTANMLLYKVFIRPKLEASIAILPPLKKIANFLDKTQAQILRNIIRASKTCSGIILRSLLQTPTMAFRMKWLRTRYVRRFIDVIEETHILKLSSSRNSSWIKRTLAKDVFPNDIDKTDTWEAEMMDIHKKTLEVTNGALKFEVSRQLPWFLRLRAPQAILRPVLNWILKRYPGMNPPTCRNCLCRRATQEHIASCNRLLDEFDPKTPHRFRPEQLLTSTPHESSNLERLLFISKSIAKAVYGSLPDLEFDILSY
jgi:hypothetical protein